MRLRELIDHLTKLETICGAETETEAHGVSLQVSVIETIKYTEDPYGRSAYYERKSTPVRVTEQLIRINPRLTDAQPGSVASDAGESK